VGHEIQKADLEIDGDYGQNLLHVCPAVIENIEISPLPCGEETSTAANGGARV
jgi:hypothetical protein